MGSGDRVIDPGVGEIQTEREGPFRGFDRFPELDQAIVFPSRLQNRVQADGQEIMEIIQ